MFKHILVPVDGSETSSKAVAKAAGLAKAFASKVTVLYVIDPYPFTGVGADFAYGQAQYLSAATAEANLALDEAKKELEAAGVQAETLVGEGHAVHEGISLEPCMCRCWWCAVKPSLVAALSTINPAA